MPKQTHKKAEHCYESGCKESVECKGMCRAHYLKDYRRRCTQGLIRGVNESLRMQRINNWDENKLNGYYNNTHDRSCHIKHENKIFALAAGTDYKRMPSILTIDNYEQEQTVGNSRL